MSKRTKGLIALSTLTIMSAILAKYVMPLFWFAALFGLMSIVAFIYDEYMDDEEPLWFLICMLLAMLILAIIGLYLK